MPEHNEHAQESREKPKVPVKPEALMSTESRMEQQTEARLDGLEDSLLEMGRLFPDLAVDIFYEELCGLVYGNELPASQIEQIVNAVDQYTFSPKGEQRFNEFVENGDALYLCYLMEKNLQGLEAAKLSGLTDKQFNSILQGVTDLSLVNVHVEKGEEYKGCIITQLPSGDMNVKLLYGPKKPNAAAVQSTQPRATRVAHVSPETRALEADLMAESEAQKAAGGVYTGMTAEEIDPDAPVNPFAMTAEDSAKHAEAYRQVYGDEEN